MHQRHGDPGAPDRGPAQTLPATPPRSQRKIGNAPERCQALPRLLLRSLLKEGRACRAAHLRQVEAWQQC